MEVAQMKVNDDTGKTPATGLQDFTDEQLAQEMRQRGFEVWKWDYWDWE